MDMLNSKHLCGKLMDIQGYILDVLKAGTSPPPPNIYMALELHCHILIVFARSGWEMLNVLNCWYYSNAKKKIPKVFFFFFAIVVKQLFCEKSLKQNSQTLTTSLTRVVLQIFLKAHYEGAKWTSLGGKLHPKLHLEAPVVERWPPVVLHWLMMAQGEESITIQFIEAVP